MQQWLRRCNYVAPSKTWDQGMEAGAGSCQTRSCSSPSRGGDDSIVGPLIGGSHLLAPERRKREASAGCAGGAAVAAAWWAKAHSLVQPSARGKGGRAAWGVQLGRTVGRGEGNTRGRGGLACGLGRKREGEEKRRENYSLFSKLFSQLYYVPIYTYITIHIYIYTSLKYKICLSQHL